MPMPDRSSQNRYYLGVDGGGTQTRALLADQNGRVRGCGHAGSANRNHYGREQVRATLQTLFRETLCGLPPGGSVSAIFLGMGGISTDRDRQDLTGILREIPELDPATAIFVENDTLVGLTGGLSGRPGLTLIAGTGSACLGINAQGQRHLCGGWGALADDAGSAPWIGQRALQAAVRAEDGRNAPTALQKIMFDFLDISEPRQLISRVHNDGSRNSGLSRAEMGRLAPLVTRAFQDGDSAAGKILRDAAEELSELVQAIAHPLFGGDGCEMVLVGGLALSGPPFQPLLIETLGRRCPQVRVREPELSPVQGAVLEAFRADSVPWTPTILANLNDYHHGGTENGSR